jgi:hypothetical protein
MKHCPALLTGCLWLLTLAVPCAAKEWRNLSPLKTTRAETLQLLGNPQHSQPDGGEYFEVDDQTITFRWMRPDCAGQDSIIDGQSAGLDALVYQITVTPKVPLAAIDSGESSKPDTASVKSKYRDWLSQEIDCIGNGEDGVWHCTIWDGHKGFGYSTSKGGVVAIYYFPTDEEGTAWSQTHKCCSS